MGRHRITSSDANGRASSKRRERPRCLLRAALVSLTILPTVTTAANLEEVVVTARKRAEPAGSIGLSVAAFSGADIATLRITSADEVAFHIVNVDLNKPFGNANPVVVIRGVGLQDYNTNNSPATGIYVDEVYVASNAAADFPLYDLERVELLKGPQGTLWGRNTTAGALNFVTRKPAASTDYSGSVSLGNYDSARVEAAGGGPVATNLNGRLAGVYSEQGDGVFYNRLNAKEAGGSRSWALRGQIEGEISEQGTFLVNVHGLAREGDSFPFTHVGIAGPACPIVVSPPGEGLRDELHCGNVFSGYSDPDGRPRDGDWNVIQKTDIAGTGGFVRVELPIGAAQLTSISSYQQYEYKRGEDTDASTFPLLRIDYRSDIDSFAQELRLSGGSNAEATWTAGVQVARDRHDETRLADLSGLFPGLFGPVDLKYEQVTKNAALFGEVAWPILVRGRVIFGLRYTHENLQFVGGTAPVPGTFDPAFLAAAFPGLPATVDERETSDDVSGRLGLEFQKSQNSLLWASVARGFKSGGIFGGFGLSPEAFSAYKPEELLAFELGAKSTFPNAKVRLEVSGFYYDYDDLQGQALVVASTGALPQLSNVGNARITGTEALIAWQPLDALTLQASIGLLDTELKDTLPALDSLQRPIELEGNRLPHASEVSANVLVSYAAAVSASVDVETTVDASYRSPYFNDLPNQEHLRQRTGTTLVGARISLRKQGARWQFSIWGRNLTDELYVSHGNTSGVGNDLLMYGEPRTYGVQLDIGSN